MLRFLIGLYLVGIVVVALIYIIDRPNTPVEDVVINALIWPYGVYKLIDARVDVETKLLPLLVAWRWGRARLSLR